MATRGRKLTASELSWFSYDSYSPQALRRLSPQQWLQILDDRVLLGRLIGISHFDEVLRHFDRLKSDPTASLGVSVTSTLTPHVSDTASVRLIRASNIYVMANVAQNLRLQGGDCYDMVVQPVDSAGLDSRAHVSVNFWATKAQIKADFNTWLNAMCKLRPTATNRRYDSVLKQWGNQQYLPFFDLHLYAQACQAKLRPDLVCRLLRLPEGRPSDQLKTPSRSLEVFTWQTAEALRFHCRSAPPAG